MGSASNRKGTVSASLLRILGEYARSVGVDFAALLAGEGLDLALLEDSEKRVSSNSFEILWDQIARLSGDPFPGLHFGQEMARHYPAGNILFTMMMNCSTLDAALQVFVRYHRVMADSIEPQVIKDGARVRLSWRIRGLGINSHPHVSEALLCNYYLLLKHLGGDRVHPLEVRFTHVSPGDEREYTRVFQCPIRFSAEKDELLFDSELMEVQLRLADPALLDVLEKYAAQLSARIGGPNKWSVKVVDLINELIFNGRKPEIDVVARKLGVSGRTLQEKLKVEEKSFRSCLELVREEIARDYLLRRGVSICDVAFLLGYAEQSAFNHAFKRWTGKTPKEYRSLSAK